MGDLVRAHAFLAFAIEVGVDGVTGLPPGLHKPRSQRVGAGEVHHMQGAAHAMQGIGATGVVFGAQKVGQHLVKRPAGVPLGSPLVVVFALATDVNHGVDGARPTQHLAAGLVAAPTVQPSLRYGVKLPVELPGLRQRGHAQGAVDQHAFVGSASLQQGYPHRRVLGKASGQHTARRAGANDDVVKRFGLHRGCGGCRRSECLGLWQKSGCKGYFCAHKGLPGVDRSAACIYSKR